MQSIWPTAAGHDKDIVNIFNLHHLAGTNWD